MATQLLYEGLRFKVEENDYYRVHSTVTGFVLSLDTYCVLDEEAGGYIAFTTDKAEAVRIVDALNQAASGTGKE